MADDLREAGLRLVLEDLDEYVSGADRANQATAGVAKAVGEAATKTKDGTREIQKFGEQADKTGGLLGKLSGSIGKIGVAAAGLGAAFAGAFAVKEGIQLSQTIGKEVNNLSKQTGLGAEEASKLRFAFEDAAVGANVGTAGIIKLSRGLQGLTDIEDGVIVSGAGVAKALFDLGVRTKDAQGKQLGFSDILGQIADRFKAMPDGIEKTAFATQLFGRSGRQLLLLLNKGSEGLKELGIRAEDLGFVLGDSQVKALLENSKAQKQFKQALQGITLQLGIAFIPAVAVGAQALLALARGFNQKVVPAIREFGKLLTYVIKTTLPLFLPQVLDFGRKWTGVFQGQVRRTIIALIPPLVNFGKLLRTVIREFFYILRTGDRDLLAFPKRMRAIIAVVDIAAEVVREVGKQFKAMYDIGRAVIEIFRFLVEDVDHFRIIADRLPAPLRLTLNAFERMFRVLGDLIGRFREAARVSTPLERIIERLGQRAVPFLAAAITGLITAFAITKVLAFASAVGELALAIVSFPFDVLGRIVGFITDFVSAAAGLVGRAIDLAINVVGTGIDIIRTISGWILNGIGTAIDVTINAAGTAIEFVQTIVSGALQRLIDATPGLKVKVEPTVTVDPAKPFEAGQKAAEGFAGGFFQKLGEAVGVGFTFISGILVGTIGTFIGNRASQKALNELGETFVRPFLEGVSRALGRLLPPVISESLGGILARASLSRFAFRGPAIVALIISGLEIAFDAAQKDFEQLGIRTGFVIGGAIIGAVVGAVAGGLTAVPTAIAGAAIGGLIADVIIAFFQDAFVDFFTTTLPSIIARLPGIIGRVLGRTLATAIAAPFLLLGLVLRGIFEELPQAIEALAPLFLRAALALGGAVIDGLKALLSRIGPILGVALAFGLKVAFGVALRIANPQQLIRDLVDQIVKTIRDPRRLLDAAEFLGGVLAVAFGKAAEAAVRAFEIGIALLEDIVVGIFRGLEFALGDFVRNFVRGFVEQWIEINRITNGGLNEIVRLVLGLPARLVLGALAIGRTIANGIKAGLEGIIGIGGGIASSIEGALRSVFARVAGVAADFFVVVKRGLDALPFDNPIGSELQSVIDELRGIAGTSGGNQPAPGQEILPGLGGSFVPGFAQGSGFIPANMLAVLHKGERVLTVQQNRLLSGILGAVSGSPPPTTASVAPPGDTGALGAILGALRGLPAGRIPSGNSVAINFSPAVTTNRGLSDVELRGLMHDMVDQMFGNASGRATALGTSLSAGIG